MKQKFVAATMSGLAFVATPQAMAAPPVRCTAQVLRSEELPYGPLGSWLVKADVQISASSREQTFVASLVDYVPWQISVRRGDTFRFDCDLLQTNNLRLRDLVR